MIPKKKETCEHFTLRELHNFYDSLVFRPKYKVSERVKYRNLKEDNPEKYSIGAGQIKHIKLEQEVRANNVSYKLKYYVSRHWIDEGQIIDWDN